MYFGITDSALSIPPWASGLQDTLGDLWYSLVSIDDVAGRAQEIERLRQQGQFAARFDHIGGDSLSISRVIESLRKQLEGVGRETIRKDECTQFELTGDTSTAYADYETRRCAIPDVVRPYVSHLVRAVRLREVRVLRGFTRIDPAATDSAANIAPLSMSRLPWLPAIEVRGEGIFFSLAEQRLKAWESNPKVKERAAQVQESWRRDCALRDVDLDLVRRITPRFLLVHSTAHAVMRQLTLECGYSSASLRERLYVADGEDAMAAVLIYTATSDADGTLGGLERQGLPKRFGPTMVAAIKAIQWCSSDPLCIRGNALEDRTLSNAACHACMLAPETSCEEFNRFLDRAMLIGTPDDPSIGFFGDLGLGN